VDKLCLRGYYPQRLSLGNIIRGTSFLFSSCHYKADDDRILSAFRGPEFAVLANRTLQRQGYLDPARLEQALQHKVREF
jgi:hypothetical protein